MSKSEIYKHALKLQDVCTTLINASGINLNVDIPYELSDTCEKTTKLIHLAYCIDCEEISLVDYYNSVMCNDLVCIKCKNNYILTIEELNAYKPENKRTEDEKELAIYSNLDNLIDIWQVKFEHFDDIKNKINEVYNYIEKELVNDK